MCLHAKEEGKELAGSNFVITRYENRDEKF